MADVQETNREASPPASGRELTSELSTAHSPEPVGENGFESQPKDDNTQKPDIPEGPDTTQDDNDTITAQKFAALAAQAHQPAAKPRGGRGGRPRKRVSIPTDGEVHGRRSAVKVEGDATQTTPGSSTRGVGRGKGGGRPRGRGRGGGRGGKRKREDGEEDDTDDSEVYASAVTMTKSGRSIQKPTSYVPPPESPSGPQKRKRIYRRNPELAVCKICLRGTSPASNMIVFCDGCNTAYHRYCHHPPIEQAVIDEVDREWYCTQCEKKRVVPVPAADVAEFISASGAPVEQRQRFFASLSQGMLVTLLVKASTLHPDLPVFAPNFHALNTQAPNGHAASSAGGNASTITSQNQGTLNGPRPAPVGSSGAQGAEYPEEEGYEDHPAHYPRPGQGLMRTLPPEQQDLEWLVDDDDRFGVFSHVYQVDPRAAREGMRNEKAAGAAGSGP